MKRLLVFAFVFLLPSAFAEMSHSPKEVSEGEEFTAWIDAEEDVVSVTFYVCTLRDPYTCYKPQTLTKNETQNNRFQFEYYVKENDYPGYKYELEKENNETLKIPEPLTQYEGLKVEKMPDSDSYYFKVNVKVTKSNDESILPNLSFISTITIISLIVIAGRR